MTTTRTPIGRTPRAAQITPKAIEAFRKMKRLETKCTCAPIDWGGKYWEHQECHACEQWWQQHSILCDELNLRPWERPAVETPGAVTPYPEGSHAALVWRADLAAQERYRALERAAAEEKQRRKVV
jgi:hypothetical protein